MDARRWIKGKKVAKDVESHAGKVVVPPTDTMKGVEKEIEMLAHDLKVRR